MEDEKVKRSFSWRPKSSTIVFLVVVALWAVSLMRSDMQNKKEAANHVEMLAYFQRIDAYDPFPLISSAFENRKIYNYDHYILDGQLTYSLFYNSTDVEEETAEYGKYLLLHGYADATPTEKQEGLLLAYNEINDPDHRIKMLQIDHGYELQLSGF